MTKLTKERLKTLVESQDFKDLTYQIFLATAHAQLTREKVDSYAVPLFQSMGFVEAPGNRGRTPGKPIEHPNNAYLSCDRDGSSPLFDLYIDRVHDLHIKNGFTVEVKGKCPALIAEYELLTVENNLLTYMEKAVGMPKWKVLEDRQTLLDLYLSIGAKSAQESKDRHVST